MRPTPPTSSLAVVALLGARRAFSRAVA